MEGFKNGLKKEQEHIGEQVFTKVVVCVNTDVNTFTGDVVVEVVVVLLLEVQVDEIGFERQSPKEREKCLLWGTIFNDPSSLKFTYTSSISSLTTGKNPNK